MSNPPQTIYSAEQIRIPPELPEILKNYAKFIIKNQPTDIVGSSATYFSKLMNQTRQAGKDGKLSNGQLNTFMKKFQVAKPSATKKEIQEACEWADISENQRDDTLSMGGWTSDQVPWMHFFGFLVASVGGNFYTTITLLITLASENGLTQAALFRSVFTFLTEHDKNVNTSFVEAVNKYLTNAGNALPSDKFAQTIAELWENPDPVDDEDVTMDPASTTVPAPPTEDAEMAP